MPKENEENMLTEKAVYRIQVTGPNSESSEYILNVTKKSTNNNIEYVKVNGEEIDENTQTGKYETQVGTIKDNIYLLEIKAEDDYATIKLDDGEYSQTNTITESYEINPGETKEIAVTVKSQNGEELTKTVSIYRKDNNINVKTIKVKRNVGTEQEIETEIQINYDEETKNYSVTLENTETLADLEIVLESEKTVIETSIDENTYGPENTISVENIALPGVGKKVITFTIKAEDGTEDTRTITISQFSSNVELEVLQVNGKDATKINDERYEIIIGDEPSTASIYAKAKEADSTIIINNVGEGKVGENKENIENMVDGTALEVPIKVIAGDGTEYEYQLSITVKSSNNNIEYVKVNGIDLTDEDKIDDKTYRTFVNQNTTQVTIDIKALSELANISANVLDEEKQGNPLNFVQTLTGEKTVVEYKIISASGEEKEYAIEILKESSDNTIKEVYVNETQIEKDEVCFFICLEIKITFF